MERSTVSEQIDKILRSQSFASKGQLRKLLELLSKNIDSQSVLSPDLVIKELWPDEIRTKRSTDVATEMNRLRHALQAYYAEEGRTDPIRIVLPNRSATAVDGTHEKRWIAAQSHEGLQDSAAVDGVQRVPGNQRKGLKRIALLATLSVALGVSAYLFVRVWMVHDPPKLARLDGSTLVIMNADGKELWRKVFPDGFSADNYYEKGIGTRIWFGDLEGKGRTDVLFLYLPAVSPQSHSTTLICYSDRGQEKWRWTPGKQLPELEGTPPTFKTDALRVLKATDKRPPRIVVSSAHDPWWPNQIAILDAHGKVLSEYWHSGHLDHIVLADLDGNGKEEIVATGISNGYHSATLIVLDPDRVFGASTEAARPELQIHGMEVAQEKLRLLFPRSDLNKALFPYNKAAEPTVDHGSIRLFVWERSYPLGWSIVYEIDKNLHLNAAFAAEDFRSAHVEFYRNGPDAHPFTSEEEAQFQRVRCLVGCKTEFIPTNFH